MCLENTHGKENINLIIYAPKIPALAEKFVAVKLMVGGYSHPIHPLDQSLISSMPSGIYVDLVKAH